MVGGDEVMPLPIGLPESEQKFEDVGDPFKKVRNCQICGKEGRIFSNSDGIQGHCGPCKNFWPISSTSLAQPNIALPGRGLGKVTLVEPDWSMANDSDIGASSNEQVGPRWRK